MKTNFQVLKIDETGFWDNDFLKENNITKIETVYLVDKNKPIFCCEITPSYWLEPLYPIMECESDDFEDDASEKVWNDWSLNDSGMYMHCSQVNDMLSVGVDLEVDDVLDYEEMEESAIDYCKSNHLI